MNQLDFAPKVWLYPIEFVTRSSRSGFVSFVGIYSAAGMVVYSLWVMLGAKALIWCGYGRYWSAVHLLRGPMPNSRSCYWMWMEVEDGLWYCLDLMEQKGGRLGSCRMSFLFERKRAATGTSITVSNSIGFLTTNKGKQTMCSMHTQPSAPPSDTDEQTRIIDIHHLGL